MYLSWLSPLICCSGLGIYDAWLAHPPKMLRLIMM